MHAEAHPLTGPDFIGQLAERQLQSGLELDATALRENARAWRSDVEALAAQRQANADMREALERAHAVLAEIRRQATVRPCND